MGYPQQYQNVAPPSGMGSGTKFVLGCGALGCGMLVLLCSGIAAFTYWGVQRVSRLADDFSREFESRGYEVSTGHVIELHEKLEKPTVFICQVLEINEKVDVNIAAVAQVLEINADVDGDIEFLGQALTVTDGAVVNGNILARGAQVINIEGTVVGKVTGTYQVLQGKPQGQIIVRPSKGSHNDPASEFEIPLNDPSTQNDSALPPEKT